MADLREENDSLKRQLVAAKTTIGILQDRIRCLKREKARADKLTADARREAKGESCLVSQEPKEAKPKKKPDRSLCTVCGRPANRWRGDEPRCRKHFTLPEST